MIARSLRLAEESGATLLAICLDESELALARCQEQQSFQRWYRYSISDRILCPELHRSRQGRAPPLPGSRGCHQRDFGSASECYGAYLRPTAARLQVGRYRC